MEGVSEDLTLRQGEELAAAIYEHRDVFSSGPTDIGRTGLVQHTIDTGDQRPVRLPPRLYSGYWQVEMDQRDIDKTAFVTRQGLFGFTAMRFGLCNAPATFERLMELVLKDLNWKICLIYLDNIIVYGAGFYPALDRLKTVWRRIRETNLKLKPTKCCLRHEQVPFSSTHCQPSRSRRGPSQDRSR